ncbi:hypothetical protein ElyMa_005243500 [Elysia marginata]|uniref:Yippee domain-containing protein n=1 Tax=Elysia marginata TaxID=1093978 RepID=A0AAV4JXL8_9GAST|nr:hypothetical protein ElyMa_005243500 [Elysia marginata]
MSIIFISRADLRSRHRCGFTSGVGGLHGHSCIKCVAHLGWTEASKQRYQETFLFFLTIVTIILITTTATTTATIIIIITLSSSSSSPSPSP